MYVAVSEDNTHNKEHQSNYNWGLHLKRDLSQEAVIRNET